MGACVGGRGRGDEGGQVMASADTPGPEFAESPHAGDEDLALGMDAPSAADVLGQLRKWRSPSGCGRFRRYERYKCAVGGTVQFTIPTSAGNRALETRIVTEDISAGGFAFVCKWCIATGTTLRAQLDGMEHETPLTGTVRRCVFVREKTYRIGVEFDQPFNA